MPDRLGAADTALLRTERPETPQHVATLLVLQPSAAGADLDALVEHIAGRIAYVPRYRQRLRWLPGGIAEPVWVDDVHFDLDYHVRRSALPRPGDAALLRQFVARVCSRPLDRSRPLWEAYVVDGLAGGEVAVVTKTHPVLVDGVRTVDLAQVLLDATPSGAPAPAHAWVPAPEPTTAELAASLALETATHPSRVAADVAARAVSAVEGASRVVGRLAHAARGADAGPSHGPLEARHSPHRRFASSRTPLASYQLVARRVAHSTTTPELDGPFATTVHDVLLAVLAGALRAWLLQRGGAAVPVLRAAVPVSVSRPGLLDGHVVDLPVGEASPLLRLQHIAFQVARQLAPERGDPADSQGVPARDLADLAGFAPATLHGLGARVSAGLAWRAVDLVATDVPGPQQPRYAAGARLRETYPVMPLPTGHSLVVGVTSYDSQVFHGVSADWDAVPDVDALVEAIPYALDELVEAAT